jgi:hypothetical protein
MIVSVLTVGYSTTALNAVEMGLSFLLSKNKEYATTASEKVYAKYAS